MPELPYLVWLAPFALYVGWILCRAAPNLYWRGLLVMAALGGNLLLLRIYAGALAALDGPRRARDGVYGLSEPMPPPHWEWALVGYVIAAAGLYFLLHVVEQRMQPGQADAALRSDADPPGG